MGVENCRDCDYVSDAEALASNGQCSECHGTGLVGDILEAVSRSVVGNSQKCDACDGSGECQTCYGKGYLVT
jgi:DnaJ-class molecular chaperone